MLERFQVHFLHTPGNYIPIPTYLDFCLRRREVGVGRDPFSKTFWEEKIAVQTLKHVKVVISFCLLTNSSQVLNHGTVRISGDKTVPPAPSAGLQPPAATAERRLSRPRDVNSAGRSSWNAGIGSPLIPPLPAPPTRLPGTSALAFASSHSPASLLKAEVTGCKTLTTLSFKITWNSRPRKTYEGSTVRDST